jgi:TolB-like protein
VQDFVGQLKERNVFRVGAAYLVASWLILQLVDVVFPFFELPDTMGKPILFVLVAGFPIALILAWVFELTPEGLKKEKDLNRAELVNSASAAKLDKAIIIILVLAIILLLVDKFVISAVAESDVDRMIDDGQPSVAILPFRNMSGLAENEYFSDGMTETLLHLLAQIPELKVAARTSAFAFKGKDIDIREIADSLGVNHVLEGSVQRSGNTVRITAQLIEAKNGYHVWSENYTRDVDDIFVVQDEIAASVAEALQVKLLDAAPASETSVATTYGTNNARAYETYLKALEQKNIGSYGSLPQAEGMFKDVLAMDPGFLAAKTELAITYQMQAETGIISQTEADDRVLPLVEQVLELQPGDARARSILATRNWQRANRINGPGSEQALAAEAVLREIAKDNQNDPTLFLALANIAQQSGNNKEALEWINRGLVTDPLSPRLYWRRGTLFLTALDDTKSAEMSFAMGRELAPEWTAVYFGSGNVAFTEGRFADGIEWWYRAMALDPRDHELPASIAGFFYAFGLNEEGNRVLQRAQAIAPQEPFTRASTALSLMYSKQYERLLPVARGILADNVDNNRGGGFNIALGGYVNAMMQLGKAEEIEPYFESLRPGIGKPGFPVTGGNDFAMQFVLARVIAYQGDYDRANAILDELIVFADKVFPAWRDNDYLQMLVALIQGDEEAAIKYAIADLDRPLGNNIGWQMNYENDLWLKPVLSDKRVQERLGQLQAESHRAGEDVRELLAELAGEVS